MYPICTVRSTPDKPVHCIVWAKEFFKLLFGNAQESMLFEETGKEEEGGEETKAEAAEGAGGAGAAGEKEESVFLAHCVEGRPPADASNEEREVYARKAFDLLFGEEIKKKISMGIYKKAAHQPTPLSVASIALDAPTPVSFFAADEDDAASAAASARFQRYEHANRVWTLAECAEAVVRCVVDFHAHQREELGLAAFDKDSPLALTFVTAASNLRSHIFGIDRQTAYDVRVYLGTPGEPERERERETSAWQRETHLDRRGVHVQVRSGAWHAHTESRVICHMGVPVSACVCLCYFVH